MFYARNLIRLGRYYYFSAKQREAKDTLKTVINIYNRNKHQDTYLLEAYHLLAVIEKEANNIRKTIEYYKKICLFFEEKARDLIYGSPDRQKREMIYMAQSYIFRFLSITEGVTLSSTHIRLLYEMVFRYKQMLAFFSAVQRVDNQKLSEGSGPTPLAEYHEKSLALEHLIFSRNEANFSKIDDKIDQLSIECGVLQQFMFQNQYGEAALNLYYSITLDEILENINEEEIILDFFLCPSKNNDLLGSDLDDILTECMVFVIGKTVPGKIISIRLGSTEEIDELIIGFHDAVLDLSSKSKWHEYSERLSSIILEPILRKIDNSIVRRLLVSPISSLQACPFDVLLAIINGNQGYNLSVSLISNPANLVFNSLDPDRQYQKNIIVVYDPNFYAASTAKQSKVVSFVDTITAKIMSMVHSSSQQKVDAVPFKRLWGSRYEGDYICNMFDAEGYRRNLATKQLITGLPSSKVLHIATHGFVISDSNSDNEGLRLEEGNLCCDNILDDLMSCGIALAGANRCLSSEHTQQEDNGLLTAFDIVHSNLSEKELVILSGCNTGLGAIDTGEGMKGLPWAFIVSGARNVICSLWEVNDRSTAELMKYFYEFYIGGSPVIVALNQAKNKLRKEYPHPYYWGGWIIFGRG